MRHFNRINEFIMEAENALFTKEQALAVTERLFESELSDPGNSQEDIRILQTAKQKIDLRYFDATSSHTDSILDAVGVARLQAGDIAQAIDVMLFEAK